ncbi:LysR family transcriptional regulator [Klebsiella pneumoniae]|uniref:LysR family transcriptional regulator n=1 Tax=Klebsiella pneumoniae TaxID=573 RepID=A0A377TW83_KLEPN|nr:LysR family transcriptional regulator [Klebsiella pneumoniae]
MLVASPEWIARHGEPQTLEELSQHNALIYILRGRPFDRWSLSLDGVVQQQKVSGTVDERRRRGDPSAGDRRGGHCL